MLEFLIIPNLLLCEIRKGRSQDPAEVRMDDPAVRRGHNIVKAAPFVHSEGQGTVLIFVPKGKFHLVAVSVKDRAALDPFKLIVLTDAVQQVFDLLFFDLQLFLIGQALVQATAAGAKMRTGGTVLPLQWGGFQHL